MPYIRSVTLEHWLIALICCASLVSSYYSRISITKMSGVSENPDKTKNYVISGTREHGDLTVTGTLFANNYRETPDKFNPGAPQYSSAGGNVAVSHAAGHAASITAQNIPTFGKQVTVAAKANVLATDNHAVDINAFSTQHIPKGPTPTFNTHGGGIDYAFRDKLTAGASVSHTPVFKQTDYSVSTGLKLHQTPTSSFNVGLGANRTDTPFGRGNWEKSAFFGFKKTF